LNLRLLPIFISLVASSAILFGGWFLYDSFAMENPLDKTINEIPGVKQAKVSVNSGRVNVTVVPEAGANIREIYQSIVSKGGSVTEKRQVQLKIEDTASPELDRWWSNALFDVAQAMETKQYAEIPVALEKKKGNYPGLEVLAEMDDQYVYVHLTDGTHDKYVMLPRQPQRLGVWPNE